MYRNSLPLALLLLLSCSTFQACSQKAKHNSSSTNQKGSQQSALPYQLNAGQAMPLPTDLLEISGITFLPNEDGQIYAVQDEKGLLYTYSLAGNNLTSSPFEKDGDYEDLAVSASHFIILKSNGTFYTFPIIESQNISSVKTFKNLLPKGEYEGLATDAAQGIVFALCKSCSIDKKNAQTSGYILKIDDNGILTLSGEFKIDISQIQKFDNSIKKTFKPSALSQHPKTKEWYILSSVDKVLAIADPQWNIKAVHALDPKRHQQPEGIAFDSQHNLYISNEAGTGDKAILYKFEIIQ
ncbi:SdiA-regulated domain-containing protein [Sphingobacterium sp. SYP-B4668]|uniref:SdiA-regulated domain-containing protein n=1 Tax=Sphingobacterium sp. SYP-B4668 TaxID=2996035 RepID=UPI0022DE8D59|nr:SdiA-regulated domain-containing protein [Sphingobacterium sp. SYP-B4668]